MKNKKNTVLFISLLVLVTLLLGVFFRKLDFTYLQNKYKDESNKNESSSSQSNETSNLNLYTVAFDASDFEAIYVQGQDVSKDGISIEGDNFVNPNSQVKSLTNNEVPTSINVTHDNSWKSINNIDLEVLVLIDDLIGSTTLIDHSNQSVYLSWTVSIDLASKEETVAIGIENSFLNIFDKSTNTVNYSASLYEILDVVAPSLGDADQTSKQVSYSDFSLTSKNTYSINGLSIAPTLNIKIAKGKQLPAYVYHANVSGSKDFLNDGGFVERQVFNSINETINTKGAISTTSDVETIEMLVAQLLNFDVDIYNAYDMPISDDVILYDEIEYGIDDEIVDIKVKLSNQTKSYYVPLVLSSGAFFEGSPREIECCTPSYDEKLFAQQIGSQMLTGLLNDPTKNIYQSYAYIMYYGISSRIVQPTFDKNDSGKPACDADSDISCMPWTRFEPLPLYVEGEEPIEPPETFTDACNTANAMAPGGSRWPTGFPENYPMFPVDVVKPGTTFYQYVNGYGHVDGTLSSAYSSIEINNSVMAELDSLNVIAPGGSQTRVTPNCVGEDFIPVPIVDTNSFPNAVDANGDESYLCWNVLNCQTLFFSPTAADEIATLVVQYPDVDQVSRPFQVTFNYTYPGTASITAATYSNIGAATNAINQQITDLIALGEESPTGPGIRAGTTYSAISDIIWENIGLYGWDELGTQKVTPDNVEIKFYKNASGSREVSPTEPLYYGEGTSNTIYYSFRTKNPAVVTLPGTIETLAPFTIKDTSTKDYSPSQSEIDAGSACVNSLVNSKFATWGPTTTMGTIKTAINNDQTFNCVDKFGLADIKSSIALMFYKDAAGAVQYSDNEQIGTVTSDSPKTVYYRYETTEILNYWETFSMPMQSFTLTPDNQTIYAPGHEQDVVNAIQNELKSVAELNDGLTYGQIKTVVEKHAQQLVIPAAASSIGINYYDVNDVVQTELDPNDHLSDGSRFRFDIYLSKPVPGYSYYGEMPRLEVSAEWDSLYTIIANTTQASELMVSFFETETIQTQDGQTLQVASDGWDYQSVKEELPKAFDTLFKEQDQQYIDQNSLSIKDNGQAHDEWELLGAGEHRIEYSYDLNGSNCSWFDVGECHPIDGVQIQGFDGVSNVFVFEVYEVIELDPTVVAHANEEIAKQISNEIDKNDDGKVDEGITTTYYRIVTIIETVLDDQEAFGSSTQSFKVEVRSVFNNSIGRPEYFVINDSNIGNIVAPQVTGFQYRIVESNQSSKALLFTDPSGYGYYTTWTGYNYHPPVDEGKIFGSGVMYWLIIVTFVALVAAGIGVGTYFIKKRKDEIAKYDDLSYDPSAPKQPKKAKVKKQKSKANSIESGNSFLT